MAIPEWRLSLKLMDHPSLPKTVLHFPETEPGDVTPGGYRVATLKQLVAAQLPDSVPDPDFIELVYCGRKLKDDLTLDSYGIQPGSTVHILKKYWPEPEVKPESVDRTTAAREFRVLQAALHTSTAYRDSVFKMLNNKESLDQIIVATPGLSSDPVALGVLQDKDLFVHFTDPNMLDMLISSHPALVNAIVLVLHSVAGSVPSQQSASSSRNVSSSSYSDMPGGFLFEGMSDDEEDFQSGNRAGPSSGAGGTAGTRPATLGYSGAVGPRPITQSELATALALASTPESSAVTPTTGNQLLEVQNRFTSPHVLVLMSGVRCPVSGRGPPQGCPLCLRGHPSPTISSTRPYSRPCRCPACPLYRPSGSLSCSSYGTWAFETKT
ncbi:ubiquitin-like protein 7a isoform X2 [Anguilla rostrata]|uniref:ubiquitin-like protein 7a isoform X2 n=1 Tax=Anguilla rostrata TaxID=7938 RepID=UPI0030D13A15